jgi:Fe-S cluster biogenesis protein NfuA
MSSPTQRIREALSEVIVPLVTFEGGEVYFSCVSEREVSIHLAGRYSGSPAAALVYQELALPLIESVAQGTLVSLSSGNIIPPGAEKLVTLASSMSHSNSSSK